MSIIGSRELIRDINEKTILKTIFLEKQIDRASLARKTGLSSATVTKIVSILIQKDLVVELGESDSTGGRKPILLCVNKDYGNILGVKVGVGYLYIMITNLNGDVLSKSRLDYGEEADPVKITNIIKNYVDEQNKNSLVGIAIAVSGTVDPKKGIVLDSFLLNWKNVKLASLIKQVLKAPVYLINDVDSFTIAHLWKGKLVNYKNALVLTLGTGIGGSIVIGGELYTGNGGAGEFGHMTLIDKGNTCSCGSQGCLESEAGFDALATKIYENTKNIVLKEAYRDYKNLETSQIDFLKLALKEDEKIFKKVFDEYSYIIGIAIKNLINIYAPECILIGGEALEFSEYFLEKSIKFAKTASFGNLGERVTFEIDNLGADAWILGGIYKVIQEEMFYVDIQKNG
jgi:N-acetylglucosamine repressor